jgi:hypothetical protein
MEAADFAAPLHQCHDSLLRRGSFIGSAGGLPPDKSFVGLDSFPGSAQRGSEQVSIIPHGLPDTVAKEPSGFHAASEHTLDLVSGNAFLACTHETDDLRPKMQRETSRLTQRLAEPSRLRRTAITPLPVRQGRGASRRERRERRTGRQAQIAPPPCGFRHATAHIACCAAPRIFPR